MSRLKSMLRLDGERILANRPSFWEQRAPVTDGYVAFEQDDTNSLPTVDGKASIFETSRGISIHYTAATLFCGFAIGGYLKPTEHFDTLIVQDGIHRPLFSVKNPNGTEIPHGLEVFEEDLIVGHIANSVFEKLSLMQARKDLGL